MPLHPADSSLPHQYISKYSASFWGQSFVKEMTKIASGSPGSLSAPAHDEARAADVAGKTELLPAHTANTPPAVNGNGLALTNGHVNGNAEKPAQTQHSVIGKTYEHAKEVVTKAKEAISQGEPHVAFSASS